MDDPTPTVFDPHRTKRKTGAPSASSEAFRARSTMAGAYLSASQRFQLLPEETSTMLRPASMADVRETAESVSTPVPIQKKSVVVDLPQQIRLNVSTAQLLATLGEDIPDATFALKKKGERLELILTPVPDVATFGGPNVFYMLGKEGSKQPAILYGTLGYILDYLVAPHNGTEKIKVASFLASSMRRPSMNLFRENVVDVDRDFVHESTVDWVIALWDSFLLSYRDICTTGDFVKELVSRFEKSVDRQPGASERPMSKNMSDGNEFEQTSFETNDNNLVVSRMQIGNIKNIDDLLSAEAKTSRSARAILTWMGLAKERRNALTIRTNALLLTLHWLRTASGAADLCESKEAFDLLFSTCVTASGLVEAELASVGKAIAKQLTIIRDVCQFDRTKCERVFGFDFDGSLSRQPADFDRWRIREMTLCYSARPVPQWFLDGARSLFKRNPADIASQWTLMSYELVYRYIQPLMLVTEKARQASAPVQDMVRLFRIGSFWPLSLVFEDGLVPSERVDRLMFFLAVAENMRRLCNFHLFFALMGGLTQPYCGWVWSLIQPNDKAHKKLEELKRAISSYGDYRVYRADMSHCREKSRIPFLGITNRALFAYESEPADCGPAHPHLFDFSRVVSRAACITEFISGQDYPYVAKSGMVFAVTAGIPGASAYALHPNSGVISGSKYAHLPPRSVSGGTYSQANLKPTPNIDDFAISMCEPQIVSPPAFPSTCTELPHDNDLELLLAWHLSLTLTEDGVKEMSVTAKVGGEAAVVNTLLSAGFM